MRVILKKDVPGLGRRGDALDVRDGYARNYLIPRDLAVPATDGRVREEESRKEALKSREARILESARQEAERVGGKRVVVLAKAGQGRLFGSVTAQDIAEALARQYGVCVDKRKIMLEENLKELGVHEVQVQLHPSVRVTIEVEIQAEVKRKNENPGR